MTTFVTLLRFSTSAEDSVQIQWTLPTKISDDVRDLRVAG